MGPPFYTKVILILNDEVQTGEVLFYHWDVLSGLILWNNNITVFFPYYKFVTIEPRFLGTISTTMSTLRVNYIVVLSLPRRTSTLTLFLIRLNFLPVVSVKHSLNLPPSLRRTIIMWVFQPPPEHPRWRRGRRETPWRITVSVVDPDVDEVKGSKRKWKRLGTRSMEETISGGCSNSTFLDSLTVLEIR